MVDGLFFMYVLYALLTWLIGYFDVYIICAVNMVGGLFSMYVLYAVLTWLMAYFLCIFYMRSS